MKLILFITLFFFSTQSFAQCTECTSFKEALKKPESVKSLIINGGISGEPLDSIPSSIGKLANLEILYLTDHNIKTIAPEIANLKKLKELSFGGNKLTEVPDFVFELKGLKELILFTNSFSESYKKTLQDKAKQNLPNTVLLID